MVDSSDSFDPYDDWLGIPLEDQPPSHYRLLGIEEFESDTSVIDEAAKSRAAYLHQLAAGPNREAVQTLLNEVARARRTLMDERSREAYDDELRIPPDVDCAAPPFEIATDVPSSTARTPSRHRRAGRRRSRSWLNDWRVHGASITILLSAAIVAVIYSHLRDTTRQAVQPVALQTASRPNATAPSRGQPSLIAPERRSVMDELAGSTPRTPRTKPSSLSLPQPGAGFAGKSNLTLPANGIERPGAIRPVIALPDNWLDGLDNIVDFSRPAAESFENRRGGAVAAVRDGRFFLVGKKQKETTSLWVAKQWELSAGQAVALDTNLRPSNNSTFVGVVAGPLRIRLTSQRNKLQLQVFDQSLATFTPPQGKVTTLAILRDPVEQASFRWVLRAGDVNKSGRIEYTGPIGERIAVGVLMGSSKANVKPPVWIDDFRMGKLSQMPPFSDATIEFVAPPATP